MCVYVRVCGLQPVSASLGVSTPPSASAACLRVGAKGWSWRCVVLPQALLANARDHSREALLDSHITYFKDLKKWCRVTNAP
jgi:hypothetical protein